MKIIDSIRTYILEEEFKIVYLNNRINIINYTNIDHFDLNKVIVRYKNGLVIIKGDNLVVSRLMNDEILIEGIVKNIEMR